MTALVLSGGGLFGAYQAGAWQALHGRIQPDLVVGVSIGSLNGYMIACGARPEALIEHWRSLQEFSRLRFRFRWNPLEGYVDATGVEAQIRVVHAAGPPVIPLVVVSTELARLRPATFRDGEITWRHLAASCALLGVLPQYRIDGRRYSDGGLLGGMPISTALRMGADRVVAINIMPRLPWAIRAPLQALRTLRGTRPAQGKQASVTIVKPTEPLGSLRDAACWDRGNTERWIAMGRRDAEAMLAREGAPVLP